MLIFMLQKYAWKAKTTVSSFFMLHSNSEQSGTIQNRSFANRGTEMFSTHK
jgi:hypothetical protein